MLGLYETTLLGNAIKTVSHQFFLRLHGILQHNKVFGITTTTII